MRKILITGKNGQVGWDLQRSLAPLGTVIALDRQDIDLARPDALIHFIRQVNPDVIVNAAAYTAVDRAESEPDLAMMVNGTVPGILAEEAKRRGALLIHYSTDYVFNGRANAPYRENDSTAPLNIYGKSKLSGEQAIEAVGGKYLIFRTSWVYGTRGKNFLLTMLKLSKEKELLKIISDQIGAPTWSTMIAQATSQVLHYCIHHPSFDKWGVYHLTAGGSTSWYGFADAIFRLYNLHAAHVVEGVRAPQLLPIPSSEYATSATRPLYSIMSHEKLQQAFGIQMPDWKTSLELCVQGIPKQIH